MVKITNLAQLKNVFRKFKNLKHRQRKAHTYSLTRSAFPNDLPVRETSMRLSRKARREETIGELFDRKKSEGIRLAEEIRTFQEQFVLAMDAHDAVSFYYNGVTIDDKPLLKEWLIRMIGEEKFAVLEKSVKAMWEIL